jgi:hypothetical protein
MVEFLTINEKQYPIVINFYVIGLFQKETGETFDALGNIHNNLYLVEPLLYYALKVGHLISHTEMDFRREDMPVILSDNDIYKNFFTLIAKFFPTSTADVDKKK